MATIIFDDLWIDLKENVDTSEFIAALEDILKKSSPEERRLG